MIKEPFPNKGIIKTLTLSPLINKLIIKVNWFEKDHTESIPCQRIFDINPIQYDQILKEDLIGKQVEFNFINSIHFANVVFPEKIYSEKEIKTLVINAWNSGYNEHSHRYHSFGGFFPKIMDANEFWDINKK